MEELDWEKIIASLGNKNKIEMVDLSQMDTIRFNPLDPDGSTSSPLTLLDMLGPFGCTKPFEEVLKTRNITFVEWKNAADKIEEIRKVIPMTL